MNASRLSAIDAFFVAYQESSGVLMQLGVEIELKGRVTRSDLDRMLRHIVGRWPPLGQRLQAHFSGLWWEGECRISEMLRVGSGREAVARWRNQLLDPFREPPFQVLWIADGDLNLLAFRAHHAVVDGEGFFAVCVEAVRALARRFEAQRPDAALSDDNGIEIKPAPGHRSSKRFEIGKALESLRRLRNDARSHQSAPLAMGSCVPGEISSVARDLELADPGETPGWLCASAWMKAIHAWNVSRKGDPSPLISIEVPVSLRRARDGGMRIGNLISPLTLYGDASKPVDDLARDLKLQMNRAMRERSHLALPALAAPARFLPWEVFRRLAANPELTGFATSHFAWFQQAQTIHDDVVRVSDGVLQIVDQRIYTPVCLHMGAAVAILSWPERTQAFLTHRLNALSTDDANVLLDLMLRELSQKQLRRQRVAV